MGLLRSGSLGFSVVLAMTCAACASDGDEGEAQSLELVSQIQCSITRGAFVPKSSASPTGELTVTCPAGSTLLFNNQPVAGDGTFAVKPRTGVNILHVEGIGAGGMSEVTDIPFLFGEFKDPRSMVKNAIALHINEAGLSKNGTTVLPLPPGRSALDVSQIATQVLRDKGNLLAALDGARKDVSGGPFHASVELVRSSYDNKNVNATLTATSRGVHLDATISSVSSRVRWEASVAGVSPDDELTATAEKIMVSADLDVTVEPSTGKLNAKLGDHDIRVEGFDFDSVVLSLIPFGLGDRIEDAIASGVQVLINNLADPLLSVVQDALIPKVGLALDQLRIPSNVKIPGIGGSVDLKQAFDGASFSNGGLFLSATANVAAPAAPNLLAAPGFLSVPTRAATFGNVPFGASVSVDYVNQALFAVWQQGLINRQLSGPISMFGVSTDAIVADAKLPPVLLVNPEGRGLDINVGELELNTVFHATSGGDARVRIAVSLVAGADIQLTNGGESLVITPSHDETRTLVSAELVGVPKGQQEAIDELTGILTILKPVIEGMVTNDLDLPPIAIPAVDLGRITPGFAGKKGRFDGVIKFDGAAARIGVEGKLMAE